MTSRYSCTQSTGLQRQNKMAPSDKTRPPSTRCDALSGRTPASHAFSSACSRLPNASTLLTFRYSLAAVSDMDMAKTKSILRMSDAKAMEFINLYEKEECLWNTRHARYKDHVERRRAAERVADSLEIPNFTYRHVQMKFKNLRNSYRQVLKKIARLDSRGILYTPTVFWFQTLDSFIKPHMHERRAAEEDHPTSVSNF